LTIIYPNALRQKSPWQGPCGPRRTSAGIGAALAKSTSVDYRRGRGDMTWSTCTVGPWQTRTLPLLCRARAQGSRPWSTTRRCALPFAEGCPRAEVLVVGQTVHCRNGAGGVGQLRQLAIASVLLEANAEVNLACPWSGEATLYRALLSTLLVSGAHALVMAIMLYRVVFALAHTRGQAALRGQAAKQASHWGPGHTCKGSVELGRRDMPDVHVMGDRAVRERYIQRHSISLVLQRWRSRPRRSRPRQAQAGAGGV
jgi:hypothetical protein